MAGNEFKFHHIGFATNSIAMELPSFSLLGFQIENSFEDFNQKIKGQFLVNNGLRLELLEPLFQDSPLSNFLQKKIQMYHQAFKVNNMAASVEYLINNGALLHSPVTSSVAFNGNPIAFLTLRNNLLVELIEESC